MSIQGHVSYPTDSPTATRLILCNSLLITEVQAILWLCEFCLQHFEYPHGRGVVSEKGTLWKVKHSFKNLTQNNNFIWWTSLDLHENMPRIQLEWAMIMLLKTLQPVHNGKYFEDNIFKCVLLCQNIGSWYYRLCRINRFLFSMRKDFNKPRHLIVEKWKHKYILYFVKNNQHKKGSKLYVEYYFLLDHLKYSLLLIPFVFSIA